MAAESGGTFQLKGNTFLKNQAFLGGALFWRDDNNAFTTIRVDSCLFKENRSYSVITQQPNLSAAMELQATNYGCDIIVNNNQFIDNDGLTTLGLANGFTGGKTRFIGNTIKGDLLGSEIGCNDTMIIANNYFSNCGRLLAMSTFDNSKHFFFHQNIIENCFIAPIWSFQAGYITNNVFANNTFSVQGPPFPDLVDTAIVVANNIFWNNQNLSPTAGVNWDLPLLNVKTHLYNNIFDFAANETLPQYWELKTGNRFGENPLFVDTMAGNFRVLPCSPARNSGSNNFVWANMFGTKDYYGQPRTLDGQVDIGPQELQALSPIGTVQTNSSCIGATNGSITLAVENGCEPLQFSWVNDNGESGTVFSGLSAGQYNITITDAVGQTLILPSIVVPTDTVPISGWITNASCDTCSNGSILVASPSPDSVSFVYAWSNGNTTSNPTNLAAGNYTVTVTNGNGCTNTYQYTVDFTVGATEETLTNLRTFPNPVVQYFYLSADQPLGAVYLMDITGRILLRSEQYGTTARIEVSTLANGIYFWQAGTKYRGRLVVQR